MTYYYFPYGADGVSVAGKIIGGVSVGIGIGVLDAIGVFVKGAGVVGVLVIKRVGTVVEVKMGTGLMPLPNVGTIGVRFKPNGVGLTVFVSTTSVTISEGSVKAKIVGSIGVRVAVTFGVEVALPPPS